jgi:hypothetical protein
MVKYLGDEEYIPAYNLPPTGTFSSPMVQVPPLYYTLLIVSLFTRPLWMKFWNIEIGGGGGVNQYEHFYHF